MDLFPKVIFDYKDEVKFCQTSETGLFRKLLSAKEANSEYSQTSKVKLFAITIKSWNPISIYAKTSTVDVWQGSEYASELTSKCKLRMLQFQINLNIKGIRKPTRKNQEERTKQISK